MTAQADIVNLKIDLRGRSNRLGKGGQILAGLFLLREHLPLQDGILVIVLEHHQKSFIPNLISGGIYHVCSPVCR